MSDRDLLDLAVATAGALAAELKNVARDVTGLMYERDGEGGLRLRNHVATADTNTSPASDCDDTAWAARGQAIKLHLLLEQLQTPRTDMVCPCCCATASIKDVLAGETEWKLVFDTHSENMVGHGIVPVKEWQCGDCARYSHSELNKEGHTSE